MDDTNNRKTFLGGFFAYLSGLLAQLNLGASSDPPLTNDEYTVLEVLHKSDGSSTEFIRTESGLSAETLETTLHHLEMLHGIINKDSLWFLPDASAVIKDNESPDKSLLISGLRFLRWQVLGVGIQLALHLLLARWLHVERYGLYSLIYTASFLLATIAALGFPVQLSRLVPLYFQQKEFNLLHGYLRFATRTSFLFGLFFFLAALPIVWFAKSTQGVVEEWVTGLALIPLLSIGFVMDGALAARKQWFASLSQSLIVPTIFIGITYFITKYFEKEEMEYIFGAMGIALLIGLAIKIRFYRKAFPTELWQSSPRFMRKAWLKTAAQIFVIAAFMVLLLRADLLVVGYYKGKHGAGLYSAVMSLLMLLPIWQAALNAVTNPDIPLLIKNGETKMLQRLITRGIRFSFWPTLALGVIYIAFGEYFLSFFGKGFEEGYPVLVILTVLYVAQSASGNPGYLLMMAGQPEALTKTLLIVVILDIILLLILTPLTGIEGAAVSTMVASLANRLLLHHKCKKNIGIRVSMFPKISDG